MERTLGDCAKILEVNQEILGKCQRQHKCVYLHQRLLFPNRHPDSAEPSDTYGEPFYSLASTQHEDATTYI